MNNIYRLVWNSASRVWVVASELASAKGKGKTHPKRLAIKVGSALGVALVGFTTIDSARAWIVDPNYVLNDGTAIQAPVDGGSIYNIAIGTEAVANRTDDPTSNRGAIAIGFRAKATHTDAIAIGMDAKAESYGSTAFGPASKITGTNSGNSIAFGNHANVQENSYGALAMGAGTTVSGINATSIGANAYSNGAGAAAVGYLSRAVGENSVVLGYKAETAAANAIAIGGTSLATADSALAIGNNAKASLIGALALGSESNSDTESGIIGYAPTNSSSDSKDAVSKTVSTRAAVSVGDTDAGILRQITDVAAGTANTDAVNVAQLKALENTPLIFAGNTGVSSKILGETVTIKGGGITSGSYSDANLKTEVDAEGNINLKIADNPTFNSLLVGGNTKVDSSGLSITDGPSVLKTGINAANQKITNVAAGALTDTSTDAVNGSQLKATNDQVELNTTNITSLGDEVSNIYNKGTKYFHANSTGTDSAATGIDAIAIGMGAVADVARSVALGDGAKTAAAVSTTGTTIAGNGYTFAGVSPVGTVSVGSEGEERTITNVAAGRLSATSTDAVNGSQLFASNQAIENITTDVDGIKQDALLWDSSVGAFSAKHGSVGVNKITNVAAGALTDTSTDAVNGSQLKATNDQVELNTTNITSLGDEVSNIYNKGTKYFHANSTGTDSAATGIDAIAIGMGAVADVARSVALGDGAKTAAAVSTTGTTIAGNGYTFAGVSPVGTVSVGSEGEERTITNVAAGRLSATSTDAVNGSQLFASNQAIENITTDVDGIKQDALLWDSSVGAFSAKHGSVGVNKITNVAAGALTDTSTDAVNGSQLKATNDQVELNTTNITSLGDEVSNIYNKGTKYFHANSTGTDSAATGIDAIAIGMGAVADVARSVALGDGAKTAAAVSTTGTTIAGNGYTFAGVSPVGTVSVGSEGEERTITNVAAGRLSATSTDAVNGSQLFASNQAIENITTDVDGIKQDALLWDSSVGAFSAKHGSVGVNKITNVAAGALTDTSTDAVNGSQLFATNGKVTNLDNRVTNIEETINNFEPTQVKYLKVNSTSKGSVATGSEAIAIGPKAVASGNDSIASGNGAISSGEGSIAIGKNTSASGKNSTVIGSDAISTASNSIALGANSLADRENTVSVGSVGNERQITNVAAGTADTDAVNVAQLKNVTGSIVNVNNNINNIAEGKDGMFKVNNTSNLSKPKVEGSNSLAGGAGSSASGNNSMSVGMKSSASGKDSVALGNASSASAKNAVALGSNSIADRENTVSVGSVGNERQISNVAAGTKGTDAVNVSQLNKGLNNSYQYTDNKFNSLKNMIDDNNDKLSAGIAGAMAMSSLPQPYSPGASMVSMGGGTYQNQSAVALGVSTISDNGKWVTKVSGTTNTQGDFGASVGVGYQW